MATENAMQAQSDKDALRDGGLAAGRRPIMALYSGKECVYSHGCRIVVYEKEVECQIVFMDDDEHSDGLAELNPYNETPTLLDRELVLYSAQIINEYLDERLPHPPLMPVDPVNRGRARLMMMTFGSGGDSALFRRSQVTLIHRLSVTYILLLYVHQQKDSVINLLSYRDL